MIRNFFITAFRNLLRNRTYAFINVFGLSLGISAALVLFKFINYHKSFDTQLTHYDNMYRIIRHEVSANRTDRDIGVPVPFLKAFQNDYPDLGKAAVIQYAEDVQFSFENELGEISKFAEDGGVGFINQEFLELFEIELVAGNIETALAQKDQIILSEASVERFFGYTGTNVASALGKLVKLDNKAELMVTGVMKDQPVNTDLPFTALATFLSAKPLFPIFDENNWGSVSSNTNIYLLKNEAVSIAEIEERLKELVAKYQPDDVGIEQYFVQPMSDIHFNPVYETHADKGVSNELIWGCAIIGIVLILTACINFVNLSTAQAVKRAKEVGVRKVLGGGRWQLTYQFLCETFLIVVVSLVLSLGLAEMALNQLDRLFDYELTLDLLNDLNMVIYLVIILVSVTILAGLYPAFVLSSLNPVRALKRSINDKTSGKFNLRRGLVTTQFLISQFLLICTLVVVAQMRHFHSADMGFEKKSIVSFNMPEQSRLQENLLRAQLESSPEVDLLSFHLGAPLSGNNLGSNFSYAPNASETDFDAQFKIIDKHYLDLFGIELLAGRNLQPGDTLFKNTLITETVMKMIGFDDPAEVVGVKVNTGFNGEKTIVGVVRDFHAHSLKTEITPLFLIGFPKFNFEGAVRLSGNDIDLNKSIADIQDKWEQIFPDYTFEYTVFEDRIAEDYKAESDQLILFQIFSGIAIFIGCLGLYGLIAFMANQKTKEIGVRKVLGATVVQILKIFSKELFLLIGVAFVLAAPLGYYAMSQWLLDFEYTISIEVWMFAVAVGFTVLIGGFTTGFRSLKAATSNPVDSLRSE